MEKTPGLVLAVLRLICADSVLGLFSVSPLLIINQPTFWPRRQPEAAKLIKSAL